MDKVLKTSDQQMLTINYPECWKNCNDKGKCMFCNKYYCGENSKNGDIYCHTNYDSIGYGSGLCMDCLTADSNTL